MSSLVKNSLRTLLTIAFCVPIGLAQDPTGTLEGRVSDPSSARVPGAKIAASNSATGFTATQESSPNGSFRFSYLPVGDYDLRVIARGFAAFEATHIRIDVDRTVNQPVALRIGAIGSSVDVAANAATVDFSSTVGSVVSSREATDLPLNGRNFTQLGLLQPGVAPLTFGLMEAGGIARAGQAYAVNGQPPESNNYLLDGVTNVDSVNGGFALRTPTDAVSEFRILTSNAPAEYGETSGATTTVITRSGSNEFHGALYDFLRNNAFDARNFFAASTEPLHQNQFGATVGGPIRRNRDFFFAYYEGQRDRQGETQQAIVPTSAQRAGDFSGSGAPLINEFTGQRFQ